MYEEYGAVNLLDKSQRERAELLISDDLANGDYVCPQVTHHFGENHMHDIIGQDANVPSQHDGRHGPSEVC